MGTSQFGINKKTIDSIVEEIKQVYDLGVGLAIVGGGNIFRGVALGAQARMCDGRLHGNDSYNNECHSITRCYATS